MKTLITLLCLAVQSVSYSQSPILVSPNGKYIGNLNDNPYDPNSVANPYGRYGSEYSLESVNNPYSRAGSEYSLESPNNPDATAGVPRVYGSDGRYLGRLSRNNYDLDSTSNPDGKYGSEYSLESINNPSSKYGSEYSRQSATYLYGKGFFEKEETKKTDQRPTGIFSSDDPGSINLTQNSSLSQMVLDLKRINAELKRDKRELIGETIALYQGDIFGIIRKHKNHLITAYREGNISYIEKYSCPPEDLKQLPPDIRGIAQTAIDIKLKNLKALLLQKPQ